MSTASAAMAAVLERTRHESAEAKRMWEFDRAWYANGKGSLVDARICIAGDPRPYDRADCNGSPSCEWGYWISEAPCNLATFESVMFQSTRYTWAQTQLARLLTDMPGPRGPRRAPEWARWCVDVMRLVSLARWASNVAWYYLPPLVQQWGSTGFQRDPQRQEIGLPPLGEYAQTAWDQIMAQKPPGDDPWLISLLRPVDYNAVGLNGFPANDPRSQSNLHAKSPYAVPTEKKHFDPRRLVAIEGRHWQLINGRWLYPGRVTSNLPAANASAYALLEHYFRSSLGMGYWEPAREVYIRTSQQVGFELRESSRIGTIYYGGGTTITELCEAWARDVVASSYGKVVSAGLAAFLDYMESIPPERRLTGMTDEEIAETRNGITERSANEVAAIAGTAGGIVGGIVAAIPVVGWVIGVIVAVATLLVQGLAWLLQATGNLAIGGAALECPPGPFARMLPDTGNDACDFDPRGEREDEVIAKADLMFALAAEGRSTSDWYDAAVYVESMDEQSTPPMGEDPPLELPAAPPEEEKKPTSYTQYLVFGGLVLGGAAILKAMQK